MLSLPEPVKKKILVKITNIPGPLTPVSYFILIGQTAESGGRILEVFLLIVPDWHSLVAL
jgi:hypothetical protein